MTLRLLPHLQASVVQLEARDPQVMATDTTAQQMLAELKRENFLAQADFSTPFVSENLNLPLGETPMLVTDVQLNLLNSGGLNLLFQDKNGDSASGASCEFNLQAALLHGCCTSLSSLSRRHSGSNPISRNAQSTLNHLSQSAQATGTDLQSKLKPRCAIEYPNVPVQRHQSLWHPPTLRRLVWLPFSRRVPAFSGNP